MAESVSGVQVKRGEVTLVANVQGAGSILPVLHVLNVMAETIEETIGFDKVRENRAELALAFDFLLFDAGLPNLPQKPLLASLLQASTSSSVMPSALLSSLMSKAAGSMPDRHGATLGQALNALKNSDGVWRWQDVE